MEWLDIGDWRLDTIYTKPFTEFTKYLSMALFLWSYCGMRCSRRLGSAGAIGPVVSNSNFKSLKVWLH